MNNNLAAAGLIAVALVGGLWLAKPVVNVNVPPPTVNNVSSPDFGVAAGPEGTDPYLCRAGVCHYYYRSPLVNSSTTASFRAPNATTTLQESAVHIANPTGAIQVEVGYSKTNNAGANATSTIMVHQESVSAGVATTIVSTSSQFATIIPPNAWVNVRVGSSSPTLTGTFSLELETI